MEKIIKQYKENDHFRILCNVLLLWLIARAYMLIVAGLYQAVTGSEETFTILLNRWDCKRYRYIVDNGYTFPDDSDPQANWAFFPMYPLVCMAVKALTFGWMDTFHVGMLVSNVCVVVAAFFAVKLMDDGEHRRDRWLVPAFLLMGPYSFYMAGMMTESMFAMFIVLFFYFCKKKKFLLAALMSAFASATRIVGCILVFALLIELYRELVPEKVSFQGLRTFVAKMLKAPEKIFALLLCPLGIFSYMAFLYFFCGDGFAFKNVQIAWREEEYFPIFGVLWEACTGQMEPRYTYMGWVCIFTIIIYIYMIYRKRYAMGVFGLITLLIPLTSHVMSTCRFTLGTYVFLVGFADLLCEGRKKCKWLPLFASGVLFASGTLLLAMWYASSAWLM